eukprot:NODE_638_length_5673_cov_0.212953.p2 type:complete len:342 gc:universal NODE_638_length_5673_cov_0.212953:3669-4694(+)
MVPYNISMIQGKFENLLQELEDLITCKEHGQMLRYIKRRESDKIHYLCSECKYPKVSHRLMHDICSLFPIDIDFFNLDVNSRNVEKCDDPYDFASDSLFKLDELLRCPITKEAFDVPLLSNCIHNFDSLSKSLVFETGKCPTCSLKIIWSDLVIDRLIESLSNFWMSNRNFFLQFECTYLNLDPLISKSTSASWSFFNGLDILNKMFSDKQEMISMRYAKDSEIKSYLIQFDIPTKGTKSDRYNRTAKFIKLFNHNLHSNRPLSCKSLLSSFINQENTIIENRRVARDENISAIDVKNIKEHRRQMIQQIKSARLRIVQSNPVEHSTNPGDISDRNIIDLT